MKVTWVDNTPQALRMMVRLDTLQWRVYETRSGSARWMAVSDVITDGSDWRDAILDEPAPVSRGMSEWLDAAAVKALRAGVTR